MNQSMTTIHDVIKNWETTNPTFILVRVYSGQLFCLMRHGNQVCILEMLEK